MTEPELTTSHVGRDLGALCTLEPAHQRRPAAITETVNVLIDRALLRGAVYFAECSPTGVVLGKIDGIDGECPHTSEITLALEAASMSAWPLCRRLLEARAIAAGGVLSSRTDRRLNT